MFPFYTPNTRLHLGWNISIGSSVLVSTSLKCEISSHLCDSVALVFNHQIFWHQTKPTARQDQCTGVPSTADIAYVASEMLWN